MKFIAYFIAALFFVEAGVVTAQTGKPTVVPSDSTTQRNNPAFTKDTGVNVVNGDTVKTVARHDPGKATLRSLILPGWGQAYNREYWKIPIVYGALGTVAGFFIYNNVWYKRTRDAFDIRVNRNNTADTALIYPRLVRYNVQDLQVIRNGFRRDRDYSALYFILTWGLNIVDATVFGHLKDFSVSEDLSLKIHPVIRPNGSTGVSLVLGFKSPQKILPTSF